MKEQYPKELCDIIRHLSSEKKREYFGVVKSVSEGNKTAEIKIPNIGIISLLNKTGERLAVGDSVLVYAANGSLSNAFVMLRYGESNSDGGGTTVVSDYRQLSNLPSINGVTLVGNNTNESLNIAAANADTVDNKHASDFVQINGTQTVSGNKTFNGTVEFQGNVTAQTQETSDNSTSVATTAFVKSQSYASESHTHSLATTAVSGFMSDADKTKLDGICDNANNYVHPSSHPATMISQDSTHRFVTDTDKTRWDNAISLNATLVTDWNSATSPGYYYSRDSDTSNLPPLPDSVYNGIVEIFGDSDYTYIRQNIFGLLSNKCMTRFKYGENWSSWSYVSPTNAYEISFSKPSDMNSSNVQDAITELNKQKAPLSSPTFTGTPAAPTASVNDSSTRIATTAFVKSQGYYQLSDYVSADCYVNGAPKYRKIATISGLGSKAFCRIDYDASYNGPVSSGSILFGRSSVKITNTIGALSKEFSIVANSSSVDVYVYTGMQGRLYQFRKGPCFNWWADGSAGDISENLRFTSNVMSSGGSDVDLSVSGAVTGTIYYSQTI